MRWKSYGKKYLSSLLLVIWHHDFKSLPSVWWIVLMSLTLIVYLSKCEQACFALFSYHVFDILRLVMWIWYWLRWKGYGKKINSFFVVWSYGCFFHMRFGPTKKLFKFNVKLCFIWSLILNVQGMNCFEKKKNHV